MVTIILTNESKLNQKIASKSESMYLHVCFNMPEVDSH